MTLPSDVWQMLGWAVVAVAAILGFAGMLIFAGMQLTGRGKKQE